MWQQSSCTLSPRPRGVHLVTDTLLHHAPALHGVRVGLLHLFLQHTSAALALNESASPDVRVDLNAYLNMIAPDGARHYTHRLEGPDDMPAHIKAVLVGPSLTLPVTNGAVALGTWQGIYLFEFRNHGGPRRIIITLMGE
jgi:secondary thiamine-phosphate synthase enzyme